MDEIKVHESNKMYTEEEVRAICECMQEINRRGILYTSTLVSNMLKTFYGIAGINIDFINAIHGRDSSTTPRWIDISREYDF